MQSLEIKLDSTQDSLQINQYGYFETQMFPEDIEFLSNWKENKTIKVKFRINGHALISNEAQKLEIVKILDTPANLVK